MKIFKVYSNCCRTTRPITEITEREFKADISDLIIELTNIRDFSEFLTDEMTDRDQDAFFSALNDLIMHDWKENGIIEHGDYQLYAADDDEAPDRPNMCGYPDYTAEEIRDEMKKYLS